MSPDTRFLTLLFSTMWQTVADSAKWNSLLRGFAAPHVLQSWEWGEFKSRWGWAPLRWLLTDDSGTARAMVQVLRRSAGRLPLCVLYCPKGPTADSPAAYTEALAWLEQLARRERAIWVKSDGDVHAGGTVTLDEARQTLRARGWRLSPDQVQFRNTVHTDLRHTDDELLAGMKQKWRYNIRLAEKRGVTIRQLAPDDAPYLYEMYAETGKRDGFLIREAAYYADAWRAMNAVAFVAEYPGIRTPLAALVVFHFGARAWYFYGMSRAEGREHMPNYLLQWAAMRWAREAGCAVYDWWGAPETLDEKDEMWGVYRFKEGFGAQFFEGLGAWDFAHSTLLYDSWVRWMPRLRRLLRGKRTTDHAAPVV